MRGLCAAFGAGNLRRTRRGNAPAGCGVLFWRFGGGGANAALLFLAGAKRFGAEYLCVA